MAMSKEKLTFVRRFSLLPHPSLRGDAKEPWQSEKNQAVAVAPGHVFRSMSSTVALILLRDSRKLASGLKQFGCLMLRRAKRHNVSTLIR